MAGSRALSLRCAASRWLAPSRWSRSRPLMFGASSPKTLQIICQNSEMACCCDDLEEAGFDTDLGKYGLGNGRLLVPSRLSQQAIDALRRHCETTGCVSTSSVVVVSQELNSIFCEQVAMMALRINRLVRTHSLSL